MKTFDIIIGNPPFQKGPHKTFYQKFVYKAYELLKFNGNLIMITNSSWSTSPNGKTFKTFLLNNGLTAYYQLGDDAFENVNLLTCYFHLIKGIINDTIYIEDLDGESEQLNDKYIILRSVSQLTKDILYKISQYAVNNIGSKYKHSNLNTCDVIHDPNGIKCIFTCGKLDGDFNWDFISKQHFDKTINACQTSGYGEFKLVMSTRTDLHKLGAIKIADKSYGCSRGAVFLKCKDIDEALKYKKYLETKLIKFLVYFNKINSAHNCRSLFNLIPAIPMDITWTDEELYKHFNLTTKEIKYIEEMIK